MSLDGWIWLRDVRVAEARVGARAKERTYSQPLEVDVALRVSLAAAAASDRLADTCDWSCLYASIQAEVGRRHWALVEALVVHLAQHLLATTAAAEVFCEVRKLQSLPTGCAAVSTRLRRLSAAAGPPPSPPDGRVEPKAALLDLPADVTTQPVGAGPFEPPTIGEVLA